MPELSTVDVFEVDHPASQADKRERVAALELVARYVHFVAVDFSTDALDEVLETAGHRTTEATTWVWEGVVPYLTSDDVESTLRVLRRRSAPGSRLVVNYQVPSVTAMFGRLFARGLRILTRQPDPLADEPRRSAWKPQEMAELLQRHGFRLTRDDDLGSIARREQVTAALSRSLAVSRVATADV
jgi:methyltransferase (TIGR00027 family)